MEIVKTHLIFLWEKNGPSNHQLLQEVFETKSGYYFTKKGTSGFFQIREVVFKNSLEDTLKLMPELHVEYSQLRKKSN